MAENRRLLPWLEERIWPLEAAHTPDTLAVSVVLSLREMLAAGCTGLLDMGTVEGSTITVDILRRSGVRAVACSALMDQGPEWLARDTGWLMEESARVRSLCGGLVEYGYAPRFALSCSDRLWKLLAEDRSVARRTTHAAEAIGEMEHQGIAAAGGNILYLRDRQFLGPGTLLAHCVHLQPGEEVILSRTDTTAVHCPWTNLRLGSGIADVPHLSSSEVRVCVASDGAPCNNRLDLAGDLRLAMALASVRGSPGMLGSGFWLDSVTVRAAQALGFEMVGKLAKDWDGDMVLIEPSEQEWEELPTSEDPLRCILELDWSRRVRMTIVSGEVLYRDGEFPTLPPLPVVPERARDKLLQRARGLVSYGAGLP